MYKRQVIGLILLFTDAWFIGIVCLVMTFLTYRSNRQSIREKEIEYAKKGDVYKRQEHDGTCDHVGIVERCDGTTVYTIEGNSGDAVKERSYSKMCIRDRRYTAFPLGIW